MKNFIGNESVPEEFFGLRDATAGPRALAAQAAVRALPGHGQFVNETELFVMTALMEHPNDPKYPGGAAGYAAVYNTGDAKAINQMSVDVATAYDIVANRERPGLHVQHAAPGEQQECQDPRLRACWAALLRRHGLRSAGELHHREGRRRLRRHAGSRRRATSSRCSASATPQILVLMYEKYGFSARVAYNWRDKYLNNTNRGSFSNPVYVAPYEQLDASVNYNFSDNFAVSVEGLNITGRDIRQYGRSKAQLWYLEEQGARYAVGALAISSD